MVGYIHQIKNPAQGEKMDLQEICIAVESGKGKRVKELVEYAELLIQERYNHIQPHKR